jgi:hypothetical protein
MAALPSSPPQSPTRRSRQHRRRLPLPRPRRQPRPGQRGSMNRSRWTRCTKLSAEQLIGSPALHMSTNYVDIHTRRSACLSSLSAGNHTMANVTDGSCRKGQRVAPKRLSCQLAPKIFPATAMAKITAPKPPAAAAWRRGLQTSMRRTSDIGTGAGRRGVTPPSQFPSHSLLFMAVQAAVGRARGTICAALKAGSRRQTHLRGQARQEETTSANDRGHSLPGHPRRRRNISRSRPPRHTARQRPAQPGSESRRVTGPNFHAVAASPSGGTVTHLVVSVMSRARPRRPDQPRLLCLVTDALDRPERRGARRCGACPAVQGWPGPSATVRMPANLETASH